MKARRLVVLLLAVVVTSAATAAELVRGDIVTNSDPLAILCPSPPRTFVLSSDLKWKSWVYTGDAVAFDSIGNLYSAGGNMLESFDSTLRTIRSVTLIEQASALAVDAAGFSYVIGQSGRTYVYTPGGILQRAFMLPNLSAPVGAISADVTPDGCTLVYVGDGASVNRFNSCAQVALAPIAAGERFEAVRALSDGGVAGATNGRIKFYDSTGRLLYGVIAPAGTPIVALSFDIDAQSLWVANGELLMKMRIIDGTITARTPLSHSLGMAVFGERRASAATLPAVAPPRRRSAGH
jgi:hypothetical protein